MRAQLHHVALCALALAVSCVERIIVEEVESTSTGSDPSTTSASTSASTSAPPPGGEGPMMALPEDDDVPAPRCPAVTLQPTPEVQVEGVLDGGSEDVYLSSCGESGPDITYAWTPPLSGRYRFTTIGSEFDTVLTVFADDCSTELACNDDADGGVSAAVELDVVEGEPLIVGISSFDDAFGPYRLSIFPA